MQWWVEYDLISLMTENCLTARATDEMKGIYRVGDLPN